jgi:hypothetical protein
MPDTETWQYQGRQEHGWFGSGTAPKSDGTGDGATTLGNAPAPPPYVATDPIRFLGHGQVGDGARWAMANVSPW